VAKSTPNSQNGRPINLPPVRNIPVNISGTGLPGRIAPNGLGGFTGNLGNDASITGNVALRRDNQGENRATIRMRMRRRGGVEGRG
jgi:hypothetical protein